MTGAADAKLATTLQLAQALHRQGQLTPARELCEQILALHPTHGDALSMLGVLSGQSNQFELAIRYFDQAITVEPHYAAHYCNRGLAQKELHRLDEALASFDRAIALNGEDAVAHYGRGHVHREVGRLDRALADFEQATSINPGFAQAHFNRGLLLQQLQRTDAALAAYEQAIEGNADYAEAHANRAFLLHALQRHEEALSSYDRAIAIRPDHAPAHLHRGNVLKDLNRLEEALESYDRAVALKPDYAEGHLNRGAAQHLLDRIDPALDSFDRAIAIRSDYADAYFNRASLLRDIKRFEAAAADYAAAAALDPAVKFAAGARLEAQMQICDWSNFDDDRARICAAIERGEAICHPFAFMTFCDSPDLQRKAAEIWVRETCPANEWQAAPRDQTASSARAPREKICIGYFSADFREHPVARLLVELIETHDRSRFEILAFSFGRDAPGEFTDRVRRAFDSFLDVRAMSNAQIATLARSSSVDIAVDLGGYTHNSRPAIFAARAAPLQMSYLGYLGTLGAPYMDYLLADRVIVPDEERANYTEKVIHLPSYQANDSLRRIGARSFTRLELGIPPKGFVYCCFNSNYKITPDCFAAWMRILMRVKRSVICLHADDAVTERNLRLEARRLGVDPGRIVFGPRLGLEDYLSRFRAMDLFLDTLPYNAGTTASDALWAGLPVLTCTGRSFAGRIAASLLTAIDLPELITVTSSQYEDAAVALGSDPQRLAGIKERLAANRLTRPLFDSRRFTRHLEAAYEAVYERHRAGLPPEHIRV
jgi:predicted O-linked N-acetylglucosamine transferase (SPINDLY family)